MKRLCVLVLLLAGCSSDDDGRPRVVVGTKKFTESYVLGEMAAQLAREAGARAEVQTLGATSYTWSALLNGDIDLYPEYTGTLRKEILDDPTDLEAALAAKGIRMSRPLGFRNNYALGMRADVARAKGIKKISDLRKYPDLRMGFTHEFIDRADGWPGLKAHYGLPQQAVRGFNHSAAYQALVAGSIDVMELYTTDGQIARYDLAVLEDDKDFFPSYEAVWLYRADLPQRVPPEVMQSILRVEGRISKEQMQGMNLRVQQKGASEAPRAAADFLAAEFVLEVEVIEVSLTQRLLRRTGEHLLLVLPSLLAAVLIAVPLGILAARRPGFGQPILGTAAVVQTIPSLALILLLIPLLQTGPKPAIAALFLYSLLPIIRNTHAGLTDIPRPLKESAAALGLPPGAILRLIELPLASRTILAGIKTAAVINVGTATLGGLIGAGGYGQPILRGIDTDDKLLMLQGAIPAALLALAVQGLFELAERYLAPRGLRLRPD